jgi:hypothetical protein
MDADRERTILQHAATELAGGGRVPYTDLVAATSSSLEEVEADVASLADQDLVEVEDGAITRVTDSGLAELEAAG